MKVGDKVRHIDNLNSVPCTVLEIVDLGHGAGNERVKIQLPQVFLGLVRYYATKELYVIDEEKNNESSEIAREEV